MDGDPAGLAAGHNHPGNLAFDPGSRCVSRSARWPQYPWPVPTPGTARGLPAARHPSAWIPHKLTEVRRPRLDRAWALVDLQKADTFLQANSTSHRSNQRLKLQTNHEFLPVIEILALPPHLSAEEVFAGTAPADRCPLLMGDR